MPDPTDDRRFELAQAYFRDEMRRAVGWRDRIDRTSNWAVVLVATLLTWAFSRSDNPHYVILIAVTAVTFFLVVETRRYRRYDIWRSRLRLMERDLFAPVFRGGTPHDRAWSALADDLTELTLKVPWIEAFQRRLRHMHAGLLYLLIAAWGLKLGAAGDGAVVAGAAVGPLPGAVVVSVVGLYVLVLTALVLWPIRRRAMEEIAADDDCRDAAWQERSGPESR